jgi:hypothetical protein
MIHFRKVYALLAFALMVTACEPKKDLQQEATEIYAESMKIHDEIMPRMDELFTLRQKLTLKLDSIKGDSVVNAARIDQIRKATSRLAAAEKDMMDWMHNIKDVSDDGEHAHHGNHHQSTPGIAPEEMVKVQHEQKEAIEKNRTDIEESIANAKELLQRNDSISN